MHRLFARALGIVLLVSATGCRAQVIDRDAQIDGALLAAPDELKDGARVYGYSVRGELVTLREGTNELTCLADTPGDEAFRVACYHNSLEPYMARGRALRADGIEGQENIEIRHQEAEEGILTMPTEPAAVYNLGGALRTFEPDSARVSLYALYIPYATQASTGIPERPIAPGAPWIMRAGTPSAHIMIAPPE